MWLHLNYEFYLFKENHKNIYGDLITNDASVLITNFEFTCKKDSFKGVVIAIFIKVNLNSFTITQILLTLSLDILYKSQLTNLNEEAAIKYGSSHLEIFYNTGSFDLTRNWPRTTFSNFITCSESQKKGIQNVKGSTIRRKYLRFYQNSNHNISFNVTSQVHLFKQCLRFHSKQKFKLWCHYSKTTADFITKIAE